MGEAIFDDAVDRSSILDGKVKVDSAGTFACEGTEATPNAIKAVEEMGLHIEKHKAKQIDEELVDWADLILTMEATHFEQIEAMFPKAEPKMHTLMGYAKGEYGYPGNLGFDVEDPYGDDLDEYRSSAQQIAVLIQAVVEKLEEQQLAEEQ